MNQSTCCWVAAPELVIFMEILLFLVIILNIIIDRDKLLTAKCSAKLDLQISQHD